MTDTATTALAIPDFHHMAPDEVKEFASLNLPLALREAEEAKQIIKTGAERAWLVGKACVHLRENVLQLRDLELWEAWAKENINDNYLAIGWAMKYSRVDSAKPFGKTAAQGKQLLIMLGDEPIPKETPRKLDATRFANFKAAVAAIRRWWKNGEPSTVLDAETLKEIAADLAPIVSIASAVNIALLNTEE